MEKLLTLIKKMITIIVIGILPIFMVSAFVCGYLLTKMVGNEFFAMLIVLGVVMITVYFMTTPHQ